MRKTEFFVLFGCPAKVTDFHGYYFLSVHREPGKSVSSAHFTWASRQPSGVRGESAFLFPAAVSYLLKLLQLVPVPLASGWFSNTIETVWLALWVTDKAMRNESGEFYYWGSSCAFNQQLWRLCMRAEDHCMKEEWSEPGARLWPRSWRAYYAIIFPWSSIVPLRNLLWHLSCLYRLSRLLQPHHQRVMCFGFFSSLPSTFIAI